MGIWLISRKFILFLDIYGRIIYFIRFGNLTIKDGSVPEWLKGMGCKPIGVSLRWFESNPAHIFLMYYIPK